MQSVTVSASHLEGFLLKAEKKHKETSEEATKALQRLKEIFSGNTKQMQEGDEEDADDRIIPS